MAYEVSEMKKVFDECEKNACGVKFNGRPEPSKKSVIKKMNPDRFLELMEENYGKCSHPESAYYMLKTRNFSSDCFIEDFENRFDL